MCSNQKPPTLPDWRISLRNAISNWDQPLPFQVKVQLAARNYWARVKRRSTCCGHDGEPGC